MRAGDRRLRDHTFQACNQNTDATNGGLVRKTAARQRLPKTPHKEANRRTARTVARESFQAHHFSQLGCAHLGSRSPREPEVRETKFGPEGSTLAPETDIAARETKESRCSPRCHMLFDDVCPSLRSIEKLCLVRGNFAGC